VSFDLERIYNLIPAVHRIRDAEQGEPLKALLSVIADQIGVMEEDLAQLYDDQFVETASAWVLPYIGDLIGVRGVQGSGGGTLAPRAEVANTIGYRRRKGTAAVLEQLARDLTGLPARAVEFFQLLATTQYMNHLRPENRSFISVRDADRLEFLGTPFEHLAHYDDLPHTADVRRIARGRGRYNIPNVGIFLWRLRAYPLTLSPAVPAAPGDARRFLISPLGCNAPLFTLPVTEDEPTHLAEPSNVPLRITRRMLADTLDDFYGKGSSFFVRIGELDLPALGDQLPSEVFEVCDLSDVGGTWAHLPEAGEKIAIDPVLGRIAFPEDQTEPVLASFHYGFSANIGGGEYERSVANVAPDAPVVQIPPASNATLALAMLPTDGDLTIEVTDSGRYRRTTAGVWNVAIDNRHLVARAAAGRRPTVVLRDELVISADENGELTIDGMLILGGAIRVTGKLRRLRLRHCTLVPGIALAIDGAPTKPGAPSLVVESTDTDIEIDSCIIGGIRVSIDSRTSIVNSIVDANDQLGIAYAGLDPALASGVYGGELTIEKSTVIGRVAADAIMLASNSIFLGEVGEGENRSLWKGAVQARRRQEGCIRFSFLPAGARVPQRFFCQPRVDSDAARVRPIHASLRYVDPHYCQLSAHCPAEIRRGADDESEMGCFHDLYQPQRETYLRARLDEYLRFGLEAGIFYAT
jgi:hypothetical protein